MTLNTYSHQLSSGHRRSSIIGRSGKEIPITPPSAGTVFCEAIKKSLFYLDSYINNSHQYKVIDASQQPQKHSFSIPIISFHFLSIP